MTYILFSLTAVWNACGPISAIWLFSSLLKMGKYFYCSVYFCPDIFFLTARLYREEYPWVLASVPGCDNPPRLEHELWWHLTLEQWHKNVFLFRTHHGNICRALDILFHLCRNVQQSHFDLDIKDGCVKCVKCLTRMLKGSVVVNQHYKIVTQARTLGGDSWTFWFYYYRSFLQLQEEY